MLIKILPLSEKLYKLGRKEREEIWGDLYEVTVEVRSVKN